MDAEHPSLTSDDIKEYIKKELLDLREDDAEDRILKICDENHIKNDQRRILKKFYKAEIKERAAVKDEVKEPSPYKILYADRITETEPLGITTQIKDIILADWIQTKDADALLFIKGISKDYGLDIEYRNILKKFYRIEKSEWKAKNQTPEGSQPEKTDTFIEEYVNDTSRDWNKYLTPVVEKGFYYITPSGGIFRTVEKYNETTMEKSSVTHDVCRTPFVLCGKSTPLNDEKIYYKVRFKTHDEGVGEFWASQGDLLSKRELKTLFLSKGINCPENDLLSETVEYISRAIGEFGTRFKTEFSAKQNGWNADKSVFVIGNRAITAKGIEPILSVGTNKGFPELEKKGTLEGWKEGVKEIIEYDLIRFKMYDAMSAPLKSIMGIESHVTDHYGNTSCGKTFSGQVALSMVGDGEGLTVGAKSSMKGILVTIRDFSDLPMLVDESSDAGEHLADLVYPLTSNKGRVKSTQDGQRDGGEEYHTSIMFTGEKPIRDELKNSGQQYRVNELDETLPDLETKVINGIKQAIRDNHGHIIELYMEKVFQLVESGKEHSKQNKLESIYDNCFDMLPENSSNIEGRSRSIFSCIMTAGRILERVFKDIGIPTKKPDEIVKKYFQKCIQEKPVELEYIRALRIVLDWIHSDYGKFSDVEITEEETEPRGEGLDRYIKDSKKVETVTNHDRSKRYGFVDNHYIDIIGTEFTKKMKTEGFSPSKIKDDWYKQGISDSDSPHERVGTFRFSRDGTRIAGVRIFRQIAEELAGVDMPNNAHKPLDMDSKVKFVYDTINFLHDKKGSADLNLIRLITEIPDLNDLIKILCENSKIMKVNQNSYRVVM